MYGGVRMASVGQLASSGFASFHDGQPYIHYDRKNFFRNVKTENIIDLTKEERLEIYAEQISMAQRAYVARVPKGFSFEDYQELMESTTEVLQSILTGPGQAELITELRKSILLRKNIDSSNYTKVKKTGSYSKPLKDLVKEFDKLSAVMDKVNDVLNQYKKVDATTVRLKEAKGTVGAINPDNLYMLKDEKAAMTAWKNINQSMEELSSMIKTSAASGLKGLNSTDSPKAMEIIRKVAGQLNQIQGLGYEVVLSALLDEDAMKEKIEKSVIQKLKASGVTVSDVDISKGQSRVNDVYLTRKTTDLGYTITVDKDNLKGSFEVNLSAKSMPKQTEGGLKKTSTTYKSGRPWSRVGEELRLLDTPFDYYFSNLLVKPTSRSKMGGRLKDGKEAYAAIKSYLGTAYALQAIGGTGIGDDMVTHVVYLNKIMTVIDVINSIAKNNTQLGVSFNPSSIVQDEAFIEGDPSVKKYVRSRNILAMVRKVKFTFNK